MLLALLAVLAPTVQGAQSCLALGGHDPVVLSRGVEEKGLPSIEESRPGYFYRFANEENRKSFRADPERYEIQLGGACGRMGPLAGKGDPARYVVHAGRTYLFASDACRGAFLKDPSRFLDPDEAPPEGDDAAREEARRLLARAVESVGGAERLAKLRALEVHRSTTAETKNGPRTDTNTRTVVFPDGHRLDETWGDWRGGTVAAGEQAFYVGNDGSAEDLHPAARREFRRTLLREPLVILRASAEAKLAAAAMGPSKAGELDVELVAVGLEGTTSVLGIDPKSGRILTVTYRGRTERSDFASVVRTLSEFRDEGGMSVAHAERVAIDGKDAVAERRFEVRVDPELAPKLLEKP